MSIQVLSDWKEKKGKLTSNLWVNTLGHSKMEISNSKIRGWDNRKELIPKFLTAKSSKLTYSILNCFDFL